MGAMKLHQILKKYKELHKKHLESWEKEHTPKISGVGTNSHREQCHIYAEKDNNLLKRMMKELEGQEVFPKKIK